MITTADKLATYARLLNEHGPESDEANEFLEENQFDSEFVELALLSKKLKQALTAPTNNNNCTHA